MGASGLSERHRSTMGSCADKEAQPASPKHLQGKSEAAKALDADCDRIEKEAAADTQGINKGQQRGKSGSYSTLPGLPTKKAAPPAAGKQGVRNGSSGSFTSLPGLPPKNTNNTNESRRNTLSATEPPRLGEHVAREPTPLGLNQFIEKGHAGTQRPGKSTPQGSYCTLPGLPARGEGVVQVEEAE